MKNSADLGGCYPPLPSASVGNTLLDLQNSSYPTQPHSVIAKLLDRQACFHILTTSWQFTGAICHFSLENVIPITHEQNIIWSKTRLDGTTHEQTIICRQLFSGHVVGSRPMVTRKKCID